MVSQVRPLHSLHGQCRGLKLVNKNLNSHLGLFCIYLFTLPLCGIKETKCQWASAKLYRAAAQSRCRIMLHLEQGGVCMEAELWHDDQRILAPAAGFNHICVHTFN